MLDVDEEASSLIARDAMGSQDDPERPASPAGTVPRRDLRMMPGGQWLATPRSKVCALVGTLLLLATVVSGSALLLGLGSSEQVATRKRPASLLGLAAAPQPSSSGPNSDHWSVEEDGKDSFEQIQISGVSGSSQMRKVVQTLEATLSSAMEPAPAEPSPAVAAGNANGTAQDGPATLCGEKDLKRWDEVSPDKFDDTMGSCGRSCWANTGCTSECVGKALGYTSECSVCFGKLSGCMMANCLWQCVAGEGHPCRQCGRDKCRGPFSACSGFVFQPGT